MPFRPDNLQMRHLLCGVAVLVALLAPAASAVQERGRPDAPGGFVAELERALNADAAALERLLAPELSTPARALLRDVQGGGDAPPVRVAVRERERRASGGDQVLVLDLLVSRNRNGRIATYEALVRPDAARPGGAGLAALKRIAQLDGLLQLDLDTARPYVVRDLQFTAPDLSLSMPSGQAFAASAGAGMTALVLRGPGRLRFAPTAPAEQDQLRIFGRRPTIDTDVDEVYVRMNPGDAAALLSPGSLIPGGAEAADVARARAIFERFLPRSYSLQLGDLSREPWSLLPPAGHLAVEFRSTRHGWLTYSRAAGDAEDIALFDRDRGRTLSMYASAETVARRGRFRDEDANALYDVLQYGVDVAFDPVRSWIAGRGRLRIRILAENAQNLSFRLAEPLAVTSATSPELGRLLPLRVAGQTTMLVSLPEPLDRGREITIDIAYNGRLEPQDLASETAALSLQTPRPGWGDTVRDEPSASMHRPEPRFVYSNRSYWYPQALTTDYAPATLRLAVPNGFAVIATGTQVAESAAAAPSDVATDERKPLRVVEFTADRPVRYLACAIARLLPIGTATVEAPGGSGVSIDARATPRQLNANRGLPERAAALIRFFADAIGEPPYPQLTIAAADAYLPGGHSPAFFAILQQPLPSTPFTWRQDPLAFEEYPEYLLAHEIAHQWWGQAVGFKSYHDQWLSEGLAQYGALAFLSAGRPDVERDLVVTMRESAESMNAKGPIHLGYRLGHIEGRGAPYRAIVYNKSAVVLHMLRRFIGDDAFQRGLRRFYRDWRFRKAGTDDLRAAFEAEAGRPLGRFFERWILGSSLPKLRVRALVDERAASATLRVEQTGDVFDLPLAIRIRYADGRTEEVLLRLTERVTEARLPLGGRVRRIETKDELTMAEWDD